MLLGYLQILLRLTSLMLFMQREITLCVQSKPKVTDITRHKQAVLKGLYYFLNVVCVFTRCTAVFVCTVYTLYTPKYTLVVFYIKDGLINMFRLYVKGYIFIHLLR